MTTIVPTDRLGDELATRGIRDIRAEPEQPDLRTYYYCRKGMDLVFCANEDPRRTVDTWLSFEDARDPVGYDALNDLVIPVPFRRAGNGKTVSVQIRLEPYGSRFIVFPEKPIRAAADAPVFSEELEPAGSVAGPWKLSVAEAGETLSFAPRAEPVAAGDFTLVPGLETFGGTAAYETDLMVSGPGPFWLDLGYVGESSEVWLDGVSLGTRICPPHLYALGSPSSGRHVLRVQVTTTLAHRLGDNAFDRAMAQMPNGLCGPVRLMRRKEGA